MSLLKREKWRFQSEKTEESTSYIAGAPWGWYHIYPFLMDKEPDYEELYWCLYEKEELVFVVIQIGAYRRQELPQDVLDRLHEILAFFVKHNKEMIVRVVYDREGKGLLREPEHIRQVEQHMRQLGPVFLPFSGQIQVMQGLLVGNWGEMHGSRFLSGEKLRRLAGVWQEALGSGIPIAVRTPLQWRLLHEEGTKPGSTAVGLFNDGMFGSFVDLGTYGVKSKKDAAWEESWCREDELRFIRRIGRRIPYGGEAVGLEKEGELEAAVRELEYTGTSYLNAAHDVRRLEQWKQVTWRQKGTWHGISGYDYIGAHMGCRPTIRRVTGKVHQQELDMELELENTGFSCLYEPYGLVVEQRMEARVLRSCRMEIKPQEFRPGQPLTVSCRFPLAAGQGEYPFFVKLVRQRDKKALQLANTGAGQELFIGRLRYL